MKLLQMMEVQPQKETFRHLAIKWIFVSLPILFVSCKALKIEDEKHVIINTLLDAYTSERDSVYLYPKIIKPQGRIIRNFLKTYSPQNFYFDACGDHIKNMVLNNEELTYYKNAKDNDEKWKPSKITSPKVFTRLELKRPESIAHYEKLSETIKDEDGLLARRYMLWSLEHKERMLRLSQPLFPEQNKDYAICFVSELHEGDFVWVFYKNKNKWEVICKMRLNYH